MLLKLESFTKWDLHIDYMITFKCNYDCSYCDSHDVNHPLHTRSPDEISDALNYISKFYNNKNILINILGGEPFLYKKLFSIFYALEKNIDAKVTTNLSFSLDFIKKNFINTNNKVIIKASYHPEYADPTLFIEKVKYLQSLNFDITCNISMHPNPKNFEKAVYILKNLDCARPHILSEMNVNGEIFGESFDYSKTQLDKIKKYSENASEKYIKATYSDKIKHYYHQELISKNLDNFKGMKCHAGHTKLHIKENGDIYPAACFLNTRVILGNMFNRTFKVPTSYVTCPFTSCRCITDLYITKEVQN